MMFTLMGNLIHIRSMEQSDLLQIAQIEKKNFPDPWPLQSFRECLRFGYYCLVLEENSTLQAYAIMSIKSAGAHILNFCVCPEVRRCGLGRRILNYLLKLAEVAQVDSISLEVRASNCPAINLYKTAGFVQVGIRKHYYPNETGSENALVLMRALSIDMTNNNRGAVIIEQNDKRN